MFKKHYGRLYIFYDDEKLYLKQKTKGKNVSIITDDYVGFKYLYIAPVYYYFYSVKYFGLGHCKMFNWLCEKLNIKYYVSYRDCED